MAILARQLVNGICRAKRIEFNPYLFTTQIQASLWTEPDSLIDDLGVIDGTDSDDDMREYSKLASFSEPEIYY